ncbi:Fe-S cluster biogenesis protein NfuA [Aequitasia blattaphilus]|uniref:NifU family protein n=1 Tax=Aequitasia blattaphilus TaxID=2949332 RepID=A0ABT1EBR1_9FIRM|nr:NifU family protein [Aequitasia blattaphilus]MCP1103276.1 NifU family protein [Aequitasia blattaphilus]MCR8615916.1 NifU family protein [Aequitasia blattaphilus]
MLNVEEIEEVLDRKVRPELALHNGNIQIERLEGTVLYVRFTGQCSGCPSADLTTEQVVEANLKEAFPSLERVVLEMGVSDELLEEARRLMKKRHL